MQETLSISHQRCQVFKSYRFVWFFLVSIVVSLLAGLIVIASESDIQTLAAPTLANDSPKIYLPVIRNGGGPLPGQIMVDSSNPAWLFYNADANGDGRLDPLFIAGPGDPEDFLYRGSLNGDGTRNGDQMTIIDKLSGTGANSIYMQAVRSHGGDGDNTHNPFIGQDPNNGLDEDILSQWEDWFTAMDDAGIIIYFFFYDDSACIWGCNKNADHAVPNEEQYFIQTLVNRYEHHKNLIWIIAEEYSEVFSEQRATNIATEIRRADDHSHPIGLHQIDGLSFDLPNDPNIDQFAIQYNVGGDALHEGMVTAWNDANGRYNLNMAESIEHGTGATARKNSWRSAMGGAYVMVLFMDVASTPTGDLEDLGRLRAFFESTNFYEMAPHDELAFGGTEYVLARPDNSYIAYASDLSGDIGIKGMSAGSYDFTWLDTATGAMVNQNGVSINSGDQTWATPGGLGNEIAVYIRPRS